MSKFHNYIDLKGKIVKRKSKSEKSYQTKLRNLHYRLNVARTSVSLVAARKTSKFHLTKIVVALSTVYLKNIKVIQTTNEVNNI